jgi:uncharacterized protein (DUF305 family)
VIKNEAARRATGGRAIDTLFEQESTLMNTTLPSRTHGLLRRVGLAGAAGVMLLATATACGDNADPMAGHSMPPSPTAGGSATTAPTGPQNQQSNPSDVMFAAMMIPHHQQAVEMSDLILPKKGLDPEVRKLAEQIKAAQQPEIDTMTRWLEEWGTAPDHSQHGDDEDGGMMTPEQMREMRDSDTDKAQVMYLEGMIEHHKGAIRMADAEIIDGENTEAIAMARSIVTSQQEEITTMQAILDRL